MTEDKRRAQYVPLNTRIAHGKTAARLKKKYGRDGLLTWILVLAAAKRSQEQGVFTYSSEPEGWQLLGLSYPDTPNFSLDAFFGFTGRGGGTKMVRRGEIRDVAIVNWSSWNDEWKKQQSKERRSPLGDAEVLPRSSLGLAEVLSTSPEGDAEVGARSSESPRKTATNARTLRDESARDGRTEYEVEVEHEYEATEQLPTVVGEAAELSCSDLNGIELLERRAQELEALTERQKALETPSGALLAVLDDVGRGTPRVIQALLDRLPAYAARAAIHEVNNPAAEIRTTRTAYAISALKAMEVNDDWGRQLHALGRALEAESRAA